LALPNTSRFIELSLFQALNVALLVSYNFPANKDTLNKSFEKMSNGLRATY